MASGEVVIKMVVEKRTLVHVKILSENEEEYQKTVKQFRDIMRNVFPIDFLWIVTKGDTDISIIDESYLKDLPREVLILLKEKIDKILA